LPPTYIIITVAAAAARSLTVKTNDGASRPMRTERSVSVRG